ncbi:MAG: hypothetical protein HY884_06845 [Deltaproteobacteria bacterium]|nr:hypothetical protein [Deltaproteobacteria bacterium]
MKKNLLNAFSILSLNLGARTIAPLCAVFIIAAVGASFAAPLQQDISHGALKEESVQIKNPHDFGDKTSCGRCHTPAPPKLSFDPVTTCVKCHTGNLNSHPISRHPIGKAPRINIPSAFPLSKDGLMVCYTCHDPHGKSGHKRMLRVEYGKLCAACHAGY